MSKPNAPEVSWNIDELTSAARNQEEFVYACANDDGCVVSWHLMQWNPTPKRATEAGIVGTALTLESWPPGSCRRGERRIHVCRHNPCKALAYHYSKWGNHPPPAMHGRIIDWSRAKWCKYAGDGAAEICTNADGTMQHAAAVVAMASADSEVTPSVMPAGNPEVTASILRRAAAIESPGRYTGLWEVLCWCGLFETRCRLLLAEGITDIVNAFAPDVLRHSRLRGSCENVIVGCQSDKSHKGPHPEWIPSGMEGLGHWVAGVAMPSAVQCSGRSVSDHCLRNGFAPILTVTNGDCGIDALLIIGGAKRGCVECQRLRYRLSAFMKSIAESAPWQAAFQALGEHDPVVQGAQELRSHSALQASAAVDAATGNAAVDAGTDLGDKAEGEDPPLPPPVEKPPPLGPSDRLRAAVCWVAGSQKLPLESVHRIASLLTEEQASTLVERHEQKKEDPATASSKSKCLSPALLGHRVGTGSLQSKMRDASIIVKWIGKQGMHLSPRVPSRTWSLFWKEHGVQLTKNEQHRSRNYIRRCLRVAESHANMRTSVHKPAGKSL